MKRLILGLTVGALALGSAVADQKTQQDNADWSFVPITGSHLKQSVKKRNIITISNRGPMITIDQKEMERNGNAPLDQQLSRYPGIQVTGGH